MSFLLHGRLLSCRRLPLCHGLMACLAASHLLPRSLECWDWSYFLIFEHLACGSPRPVSGDLGLDHCPFLGSILVLPSLPLLPPFPTYMKTPFSPRVRQLHRHTRVRRLQDLPLSICTSPPSPLRRQPSNLASRLILLLKHSRVAAHR